MGEILLSGSRDLFPAEHCRATFHERLDAFFHVFAAEDAILDLWNVIDRSLFTGLDVFQRGFLGHLNTDRRVTGSFRIPVNSGISPYA